MYLLYSALYAVIHCSALLIQSLSDVAKWCKHLKSEFTAQYWVLLWPSFILYRQQWMDEKEQDVILKLLLVYRHFLKNYCITHINFILPNFLFESRHNNMWMHGTKIRYVSTTMTVRKNNNNKGAVQFDLNGAL